jgi:hypothetical protein
MKKIIFLILCFLFYASIFKAQKLDNEWNVLRDSAIVIKADDLYKFYNEQLSKDVHTENWKIFLDNFTHSINNLYLLDENNKSFKINKTSKISFKGIDIYDKKNRKLLKQGIDVWKVIQILNGNRITITIIDFKVTYKNKNYQFANGGGSTIVFEYSCSEDQWKLLTVKHSGI